ncbi:3-isopropylmalate dehydratase small subunit [Candidatus Aquiluna sp. UB-MaderosW2red]|uniref:3-isopropylmalate dehydratase small subunit n=1 Tax=Candidatus Aquiluna sp. UB-MaderosW2red TaxID=1855377 RepID=UPI000875D030|nr:3-isopropylmalate dehydratase small subunit [Candidatus Aquiluna sp. UB-MaderosW2red]SCX14213.1 3-isopropylmalate/(R)-2-methylmalate dehydratase small subunit [Candidatus Aquiluna sp. UB-MaderosW2red]
MEKITVFEGLAAPLQRSNVDTDQIIPAVYLKRITKTGFEDGLFATWRQDPEFVLNQPQFQGAQVLFTGPDFGTGSSREHAVWALKDFGFKAVFAAKFADIFSGNSGKQGLIAGVVKDSDIEAIWAKIKANPGIIAKVDLPNQLVSVGDLQVGFGIDEYTKWRLTEGLDDIGITLQNEAAILAYEAKRESWKPKTLPAKGV